MEFATRNQLHVIVDEIYGLSMFQESITFQCSEHSLPDSSRTYVIWGTNEDFNISGFCIGAQVASVLSSSGDFHGTSGFTRGSCVDSSRTENQLPINIRALSWLRALGSSHVHPKQTEGVEDPLSQ